MAETFKALVVREAEDGSFSRSVESCPIDFLPTNSLTIEVAYAALNYKDALSASGHKGITRQYPHIPGVDAAGYVVEDLSGRFEKGAAVICTSYDLGMNTPGGFGARIRVPSEWAVPLPEGFDLRQSMVYGTAAYTAALALHKMEQCGQAPDLGPIAVTGASGGVGSMAVALLHHVGYKVLAVSGKPEKANELMALGASEVLPREEANDRSKRPLVRPKWAGAIDNVGGNTLTTLLKACGRNGSVASVGLVASPNFESTVYPFILNGVNLLGVDSAETPASLRTLIWEKLAGLWRFEVPENWVTECSLEEVSEHMEALLRGQGVGRVIVKHH